MTSVYLSDPCLADKPEGSGPWRTQSLLRIPETTQLPLCHRAVLLRVRAGNEGTIYTSTIF